ncbi:hypothetical protein CWB58_05940 [Pseudoalteromonas sp. S201]|jgi:hypothetical protein|uniref:hypothetical protein n=1 Tax=unclassified Pseudoalteromonas TaxID=194690 RepID=UPI000429665A|nr:MULTISPECIES: hypothetical protein [unclassified Pseudoalteromonas]TMS94089.1 hypothetical protein CWB58_05940 [Pseudoalteromonas sp. S201]|tara:strand:+ start:21349 stop:22023 length:675 start_codon:yes stop_codon:yes gene_type:complete
MNQNVLKLEEFEDKFSSNDLTHGINPSIFRDAIHSGLVLSRSVTKFHPLTAGGSRAWEEIVATFRELVIEYNDGWKAVQQSGMPVLINSERGITIVITSGDENTGLKESSSPKTKNAKGQVTEGFVERNYDLFDDMNNVDELFNPIDSHQTWILLYTFDKNRLEIRYELSLPTSTSISGNKGKIKICDWQTRLIFPAISYNELALPELDNDFTDDTDFFDIEEK